MTMLETLHGSRPKHHTAEAALKFMSHNAFEAEVAARAVAYTTICFLGRGRYDRWDYNTYEDALAGAPRHGAARGKGVLIYAVDDRGFTALLATLPRPKNWRRRNA